MKLEEYPRPDRPEEFYWQLFQQPWQAQLHEEAAVKLWACPSSEWHCASSLAVIQEAWAAEWSTGNYSLLDREKGALVDWMQVPGGWALCLDEAPESFTGYPDLAQLDCRFFDLVLTGPPYEECTELQEKNPLDSDSWVTFQDEGHLYFFTDEAHLSAEEKAALPKITSVTTLNHHSWWPFNEPVMAKACAGSRTNPRYSDKSEREVLEMWEFDRCIGTQMHFEGECLGNGRTYQYNAKEMFLYRWWLRDHPELEFYRTEKRVADKQRRIAGSADLIFRNKDTGIFYLADLKRCWEIRYQGFCRCYRETLIDANGVQKTVCRTRPGQECKRYGRMQSNSETDDCNLEHYRQQLTVYRYYFEKNDKLKFYGQSLIVLNPRQQDYISIAVDLNIPLLFDTLKHREEELFSFQQALSLSSRGDQDSH
jgi:hypothetical protein